MKQLAHLVLNRSWAVIILFALITVLLGFSASRTGTDNTTHALYPDHSVVAALQDEIAATFGQRDMLLVVTEGEIFTPAGLSALHDLTLALSRLEGATNVTSVATARRMEDDDGFLVTGDLLDAEALAQGLDQEQADEIRRYLSTSPLYENVTLVSSDGRHATLIVELEDGIDASEFARSVDDTVRQLWDGPYALAGQAFTSMELQSIIKRDLPALGATAIVLILIFLALNFRSVQGTLLPFVQIITGVVWGMGLFQLLGHKLMALTVIGPIAVMAVGSSFALHLLGRYYFELARGANKQQAIRLMLMETGLGVMISGFAIAAAMSTFLLSDLAMVRGLGLISALGVLSALLASMLFLPALLNVLPVPRRVADTESPGLISGFLVWLGRTVVRRRRAILSVSTLLIVVAVIGVFRIVPNTSIIAFFPESGATRTSIGKVEQVMGGSAPITVEVEGDILDPVVLQALERFQQQASALDVVGPGQSIANVLRALHLTLTGENSLPPTRQGVAQELLLYQSSGEISELQRFVTLDYSKALVRFTAKAMPTERAAQLQQELIGLARDAFGELAIVQIAGQPLLEYEIEQAMRRDFLVSLTLAILLVIIIDSFVRSFRAAAVTVLVLLVTIALQYGILGWAGLPLNLATMLMGALAIGVGDYAIHLTVRYMEERRHGLEPEAAVQRALFTSGRQILFTALTLGAGFSALVFADFVPVKTLGSLMLLTVALVGVSTLTLLPAASLWLLRNPHSRANRSPEVSTHA